MVTIQNAETVKEILESTGLKVLEGYPTTISPSVVATLNVNPKDYQLNTVIASANQTTSGAITVYTSHPTKRTFLTGIMLSVVKNATCDMANGYVNVTASFNSVSKVLAGISILTLTAQESTIFIDLKNAEIDKNSFCSLWGTYTAGAMVRSVILYGYERD